MKRTRRQCHRRTHFKLRPLYRLDDIPVRLAEYYANYYGPCRVVRHRTLTRKAEAMMALFDEVPA